MPAVQFVPKAEAQPGDHVREVDSLALSPLPVVVRLDGGTGLFVGHGAGERFVSFERIEAVLRPVAFGPND